MDNGFIWKGVHSNDYDIICETLPSLDTADARIDKILIPGRDGFLTIDEGVREGDIKTVTFHLLNEELLDQIKRWLSGTDKVIFSTQPDRYYKATIISKVNIEEIIPILHKGMVQFDIQPYGYLFTGADLITITSSGSFIGNKGNYKSEPYIKIYASGDITLNINNQSIRITNVDEYVELDTQLDEIFKGTTSMEDEATGECPFLEEGSNEITWIGSISKIEIIPRWRCL